MQHPVTTTQPTLLTIAQVAQQLQLSRAKVYQLVYTAGLPIVTFGTAMRVRPESLEHWLKQREK